MKRTFCRAYPVLLAAASVLLHTASAWADGGADAQASADDSGFTVLSNATNVTHWGLGVGAGVAASPYKSGDTKFTPIPLISFDNKWIHALGTTIDLKIGKWDNVSVALRGDYAVGDGYRNDDAPILNGMQNRNGTFWYGPALAWKSAFGTLSADYLLGGNRGERAKLDFSKSFDLGRYSIEPYASVEWLSSDYVDYYYGVQASEARAGRPEYTGRAAYDTSVGTRVNYSITRRQKVVLDVGVSHFTSGVTDSPIVGRSYLPAARLGYIYQFN
ncbi:MipA/OmpV family protein [Paraburkholderia phenazinium]|uniref:Outer membrane protein n=1 Tax=Paraburkholderia phenazinium TaxID=60549 RepID=A0A1N6KSF2_9BURK|nr:MipA/OmpV family protein [Paraburkholderia phenazinium]SIO59307.1 outer membrane protein [Paraburkholderia phenazinium]